MVPSLTPSHKQTQYLMLHARTPFRIRPKYHYDFSRAYLGPNGLTPLIEALAGDDSFASLGLSGVGATDRNCRPLCELLARHPGVTAVDLSNNPIGDRGGVLLAELLAANPRIMELNIKGTHLLRWVGF